MMLEVVGVRIRRSMVSAARWLITLVKLYYVVFHLWILLSTIATTQLNEGLLPPTLRMKITGIVHQAEGSRRGVSVHI
jgi:hypothetical protein